MASEWSVIQINTYFKVQNDSSLRKVNLLSFAIFVILVQKLEKTKHETKNLFENCVSRLNFFVLFTVKYDYPAALEMLGLCLYESDDAGQAFNSLHDKSQRKYRHAKCLSSSEDAKLQIVDPKSIKKKRTKLCDKVPQKMINDLPTPPPKASSKNDLNSDPKNSVNISKGSRVSTNSTNDNEKENEGKLYSLSCGLMWKQ